MLRERVLVMRACSCLWTPCRCIEISQMTSQERYAEQDRIARDYLKTVDARAAERRRDAVMAVNVDRFGMDGQTVAQRERPRPLSQQFRPSGYQAWNHPNRRKAVGDQACAHCRVQDDDVQLTKIDDGPPVPLHPGQCQALWKLAQKGQPRY